jgi:hypothetical protein
MMSNALLSVALYLRRSHLAAQTFLSGLQWHWAHLLMTQNQAHLITQNRLGFVPFQSYRPSAASSKTEAEGGEVQGHLMVLGGPSFHCSVVFFVLRTDSLWNEWTAQCLVQCLYGYSLLPFCLCKTCASHSFHLVQYCHISVQEHFAQLKGTTSTAHNTRIVIPTVGRVYWLCSCSIVSRQE